MRILDTILRLLPYQRTMLETDIPADATLEWRRRPRRGIRLVSSRPRTSNVGRGYSGHVAVDEFNPSLTDMQDYLPGGDYPLTYEQALDKASYGNMVQCSFGLRRYIYWRALGCLVCHWEQPSDAERRCGWRIVPSDNN